MGSVVGTKKRYGSAGTGPEVAYLRRRVDYVIILFIIFLFTCHGRINVVTGFVLNCLSHRRENKSLA